jgi:hypothetical protein
MNCTSVSGFAPRPANAGPAGPAEQSALLLTGEAAGLAVVAGVVAAGPAADVDGSLPQALRTRTAAMGIRR